MSPMDIYHQKSAQFEPRCFNRLCKQVRLANQKVETNEKFAKQDKAIKLNTTTITETIISI